MNKSAELIIDDAGSLFSPPHAHTAGEMGAKAATRYLKSHTPREESLLPEIVGNALAAAFVFGIFLGRYFRQ